jgi:hypothetical protein
MWYLSKAFTCFPFLPVVMTSIVSHAVPYVCPVFNMWLVYPELVLLLLMSWIRSLYLMLNVQPVCSIYFNGQSSNFIWYMPLLLYLSLCAWGFNVQGYYKWFIRFQNSFLALSPFSKGTELVLPTGAHIANLVSLRFVSHINRICTCNALDNIAFWKRRFIYSNPVFVIVLCVRNAIFTRVSWKSFVILLTHFGFWFWGSVCFVFVGEVVSWLGLSYTRYCVVCSLWLFFLCVLLFQFVKNILM